MTPRATHPLRPVWTPRCDGGGESRGTLRAAVTVDAEIVEIGEPMSKDDAFTRSPRSTGCPAGTAGAAGMLPASRPRRAASSVEEAIALEGDRRRRRACRRAGQRRTGVESRLPSGQGRAPRRRGRARARTRGRRSPRPVPTRRQPHSRPAPALRRRLQPRKPAAPQAAQAASGSRRERACGGEAADAAARPRGARARACAADRDSRTGERAPGAVGPGGRRRVVIDSQASRRRRGAPPPQPQPPAATRTPPPRGLRRDDRAVGPAALRPRPNPRSTPARPSRTWPSTSASRSPR